MLERGICISTLRPSGCQQGINGLCLLPSVSARAQCFSIAATHRSSLPVFRGWWVGGWWWKGVLLFKPKLNGAPVSTLEACERCVSFNVLNLKSPCEISGASQLVENEQVLMKLIDQLRGTSDTPPVTPSDPFCLPSGANLANQTI